MYRKAQICKLCLLWEQIAFPLTIFTRVAYPALKTILIHLQYSPYFCLSVIPLLLIHLSLAPQGSSQRMGIFYLYFLMDTFEFYNLLCLFLVFVSSSPVCLGKMLSTEIVYQVLLARTKIKIDVSFHRELIFDLEVCKIFTLVEISGIGYNSICQTIAFLENRSSICLDVSMTKVHQDEISKLHLHFIRGLEANQIAFLCLKSFWYQQKYNGRIWGNGCLPGKMKMKLFKLKNIIQLVFIL